MTSPGILKQNAVLTGSGTIPAAARAQSVHLGQEETEQDWPLPAAEDPRPWLVIVDSRGRVSRLDWLRRQPFWREILILCSETTPSDHLARLGRHRITHLIAGSDHVDLPAALDELAVRHHITAIRVDVPGIGTGPRAGDPELARQNGYDGNS